jgi:hypothetical protein
VLARREDQRAEAVDLVVGQVLALDLRVEDLAHDVVGSLAAPEGDRLSPVGVHLAIRLHRLGPDEVLGAHRGEVPLEELLTVGAVQAHQLADHGRRDHLRVVGGDVSAALLAKLRDQPTRELAHERLQPRDARRREHPRQHRAELVVARRIHVEHVRRELTRVGADQHAASRREGAPVGHGRLDVGVAGHHVAGRVAP